MSIINKKIQAYAIQKQRIERILKWTPLEYCEFQWSQMEDYIIVSGQGDTLGLDIQGRSVEYRKWWVNQWNIRDVINVELIDQCYSIPEARILYRKLHDAKWLHNEYEEKEALEASEAYAVGRAIDEMHRKCKTAKQLTQKAV